jgi:hypothetical protein
MSINLKLNQMAITGRTRFLLIVIGTTAVLSNFSFLRRQVLRRHHGDDDDHQTSGYDHAGFEIRTQDNPYGLQFWNDQKHSYVKKKYVHKYPKECDVEATTTTTKTTSTTTMPADKKNPIAIITKSNPNETSYTIRVVYFLNTKLNDRYLDWITNQISIVPTNYVKEIYIVADSKSCIHEKPLHDTISLLQQHKHANNIISTLECHDNDPTKETYEYHGIHKLWELGQRYSTPNDIAIYVHSKGVTHAKSWNAYIQKSGVRGEESKLTQNVFGQMPRVLEAFSLFPNVDRVGWDCSAGGFLWYNFMYVRGSYLNQVEQPIITTRRHYYEEWIRRAGLELQPNAPYAEERRSLYILSRQMVVVMV